MTLADPRSNGPLQCAPTRTAAGLRISEGWLLAAAGALAAAYPSFLQQWHTRYVADGVTLGSLAALLDAYLVPAAGFALALVIGRSPAITRRTLLLRRLATLMVAVPPAFTLLGVLLYLMKINNADASVWRGLCAVIAAGALLRYWTLDPAGAATVEDEPGRLARLRYSHGLIAAVLFGGFVAWHLLNHLFALQSSAADASVMRVFRIFYRNRWVEPTLLVLIAYQLLAGLILWKPKTRAAADAWATLQTTSGIYLAVYLVSHVNSVFVLARHFGIETDWAWATGAPTGLVADAWDIRLLPHYSLAVFMVLAHLSVGFRGILLAHSTPRVRANRITWGLLTVSAATTVAISVALLGG